MTTQKNVCGSGESYPLSFYQTDYTFIPLIQYKSILSFYFDATSIQTKIPLHICKKHAPYGWWLNGGVLWCSDIRIMRDREVYWYCMYRDFLYIELDSPV